MPEIKLFYKNCNCCSGSGSSGSGSQACGCNFFSSTCSSSPVHNECKTDFVASISFDFSECGSFPIGSCGSGSAASGAETGLDGPETGSGSDCIQTCPDCCDLLPDNVEIPLTCVGSLLISDISSETDPKYAACKEKIETNAGSCLQVPNNSNACNFMYLDSSATSGTYGNIWLNIDNNFVYLVIDGFSVTSCEPVVVSGSFYMAPLNDIANAFPCLGPCIGTVLTDDDLITSECVKGTFTITEALAGGGGGGGGGGGPIL
jgi:hypothetical protein